MEVCGFQTPSRPSPDAPSGGSTRHYAPVDGPLARYFRATLSLVVPIWALSKGFPSPAEPADSTPPFHAKQPVRSLFRNCPLGSTAPPQHPPERMVSTQPLIGQSDSPKSIAPCGFPPVSHKKKSLGGPRFPNNLLAAREERLVDYPNDGRVECTGVRSPFLTPVTSSGRQTFHLPAQPTLLSRTTKGPTARMERRVVGVEPQRPFSRARVQVHTGSSKGWVDWNGIPASINAARSGNLISRSVTSSSDSRKRITELQRWVETPRLPETHILPTFAGFHV